MSRYKKKVISRLKDLLEVCERHGRDMPCIQCPSIRGENNDLVWFERLAWNQAIREAIKFVEGAPYDDDCSTGYKDKNGKYIRTSSIVYFQNGDNLYRCTVSNDERGYMLVAPTDSDIPHTYHLRDLRAEKLKIRSNT